MKILEQLSRLCAILGGLLMVFIALMTVTSVIGRDFFGKPIDGDLELTAATCGAVVALFMPWCQFKRGNIIVDFFTNSASQRTQDGLDRLGALLMAVVMGVMTWRSAFGGISAWDAHSSSQLLGLPDWTVYVILVPALGLTSAVALAQAVFGFAPNAPEEDNPELAL